MGSYSSFIILIVFIAAMYFLMIRPQKKRDKQIQEMRSSLSVGDEIVTIGGICGKIVKTKDETIVIQVGADKVKFEMMRWSVSSVVNAAKSKTKAADDDKEDAPKKTMPRKLKKAADAEETEAPAKAEKADNKNEEKAEVKPEEKTEAKAEETAEEKTEA